MKSAGIMLVCTALIMTGIYSRLKLKKRKSVFVLLSELLNELSFVIVNNNMTVVNALEVLKGRECFSVFSFPEDTLGYFSTGDEPENAWKKAVGNDLSVRILPEQLQKELSALSVHFNDVSSSVLARKCREISDNICSEGKKYAEKSAVNEKLILTGSLLGAAAVGIILF